MSVWDQTSRYRRSHNGSTVHRWDCPRAANAVPWTFADDKTDAQVFYAIVAAPWLKPCRSCKPFQTARAASVTGGQAGRCCKWHNEHCEPPGDLCCSECTEFHHGVHVCPGNPTSIGVSMSHHDGSVCTWPNGRAS
jgi:hypothetical protein